MRCVMKNYVLLGFAVILLAFLGSCASGAVFNKTEMSQKNYKKIKARQAPINSLHYAKRYWKPKYKKDAILSFSKKPAKKPKPKPEYTHE